MPGKVISFRFSDALRGRIERYAASVSERAGVEVPLTRVVTKLLELGLDQVEKPAPKAKKK
jgi:hypothetical protein